MYERLIYEVERRWGYFEMELFRLSYSPAGKYYEATFISPNDWTVSHYFQWKRPSITEVGDYSDYACWEDGVLVWENLTRFSLINKIYF